MAKDQESRLFTYWLSYALAAIVFAVPNANWAFIALCTRASRESGINACRVSGAVDWLATAVPVIERAVALLEQRGLHLQAEVFASTLSVAWASAIATAAVIALVTWLTVALLSRESKLAFTRSVAREPQPGMPDRSKAVTALSLMFGIAALEEATWGQFGQLPPSVMADTGDRALYLYSVLLGFFLLGLFLPAVITARNVVLRSSAA